MKIGIFLSSSDPLSGGGHTFESHLIQGLDQFHTPHKFVLFHQKPLSQQYNRLETIDTGNIFDPETKKLPFKERLKHSIMAITGARRVAEETKQINKQLSFHNFYNDYNNRLNFFAKREGIEAFWFITPEYIPIEIPYLATVWDLGHKTSPHFPEISFSEFSFERRELMYRAYLGKAFKVMCGTSVGCKDVSFFYNLSIDRCLTNPFFTPYSSAQLTTDTSILNKIEEPFVYYPAQYWPHKNHIAVIRAISLLNQKGHNISAVFSGSDKGNREFLKKEISNLNINSKIHLFDFVSESQKIALYKNALALCFTSLLGPDNIPPLEAMSLECPVIAHKSSGAEEQLGDAAMLVNTLNPEEIADAILEINRNGSLRDSLSEKGKQLVSNRTVHKYIDTALTVFDELQPFRACWVT